MINELARRTFAAASVAELLFSEFLRVGGGGEAEGREGGGADWPEMRSALGPGFF